MIFRALAVRDYPAILTLNEKLVHFLSPMDETLLGRLHGQSELVQVLEENGIVIAFMIVMREGKQYNSENYLWFSQRYPKFLYVDRIVVDATCHHYGYGKRLYDEVFSHARQTNVPLVTAEVNIQPPNLVSLGFHQKMGFQEVGTQWLQADEKQVSLLAAEIK